MKRFCYCYINSEKISELKKEQFYEGERVLYKSEEIKLEDETNKEYNMNLFLTNFRFVLINEKAIFDIPLIYITSHYVKRPFITGSNYINLDLKYNMTKPVYILENINPNELNYFSLPKYCMLKFRSKDSDIDTCNKLVQDAIKNKDYLKSYRKVEQENQRTQSIANSQVTGIGMERVKNMMMNQINENKSIISNSFNDIESLKVNLQPMVEIAQQIRAKLSSQINKEENYTNDINSILQTIGFIDPVTKENSGKAYYEELALQINEFFKGYLADKIGIITLVDAYCIYNRARGMNTISPSDMKNALKILDSKDLEVKSKVYENDMIMIHSKNFSLESIYNRIKEVLELKQFISVNDFSKIFEINTIFGKILIEEMLKNGLIVVDEADLEVRYYRNTFLG